MTAAVWNLDTTIETLSDEEKKKNLTAADFVKLNDVLWPQNLPDEDDEKHVQREQARNEVLLLARNKMDELAQSDFSESTLEDLSAYTGLLETYANKDGSDFGTTATEVMKRIENRTAEIKQQSLDAVGNAQNLSPADLWTLRQNLKTMTDTQEGLEANKKLEEVIVAKAQDVAENKTVILDINQGYDLQNLLQDVHEHPFRDNADTDKTIIEQAQTQLKDIIDTFEEQYGVGKHLLDEEIVKRNIAALETMPSDEVLFSYEEPESKLSQEIDFENIRGAYTDAQKKGETLDIARLSGVLQYRHLNLPQYDEVRKNLLEMALKHVKETDVSKLETKDFANFGMLLQKLQASNKNDDKKTAKLLKEKQDTLTARKKTRENLKYPEFASVMNVLDNLQVDGDITLFGREKISQDGADSEVNLFKERIRQRTEIFLANTSKDEITEEVFRNAYNEQLKLGIVEVVYADKISKGNLSKKDMLNMFDELDKAAAKGKPIRVNQTSFVGWQTVQDNRSSAAAGRMEAQGQKSTGKTWFRRIRELDSKYLKKHPTLYPLLKTVCVSGGWGAMYGIGSTFGPAGVAVVASASFAYSGYKFFRGYVEARKQAKTKGEKLGFWKFIKNNKLQAAGFALSAASAAFGISSAVQAASAGVAWAQEGLGLAAQDSSLAATFQLARAKAGYLLAATGAIDRARKVYQKQDENDTRSIGKRRWDAVKAFGLSALSFGAGMYTGRAAGAAGSHFFGQDAIHASDNTETSLQTVVEKTVQPTATLETTPETTSSEQEAPKEPVVNTVKSEDTPKMQPSHRHEPPAPSQPVSTADDTEIRRLSPISLEKATLNVDVHMPTQEELHAQFEQTQEHIHQMQARGLGVQTIERLDNGDISVERISPEGRHYHSVVSPDGKFVSLTVEGKEFPQDRLNHINNPEKGITSPILDQNKQLFMLAPAIGEDVRDFTVSPTNNDDIADVSKNTPADVEEKKVPDAAEEKKVPDAAEEKKVPDAVEEKKVPDAAEEKKVPDALKEDKKISGSSIGEIPAATEIPLGDEADDTEHKHKDEHNADTDNVKKDSEVTDHNKNKNILDKNPVQDLVESQSTISWENGTDIKNGSYIEVPTKDYHTQILGRDDNGNLYKLTELDVGWQLDLPKDHPDYETLQTSRMQISSDFPTVSHITPPAGKSPDDISNFINSSQFSDEPSNLAKSIDAQKQIDDLAEKYLLNVRNQNNVTTEWKNAHSSTDANTGNGSTADVSAQNASGKPDVLALSGRPQSHTKEASFVEPTEKMPINVLRGIDTNNNTYAHSNPTPHKQTPVHSIPKITKEYSA